MIFQRIISMFNSPIYVLDESKEYVDKNSHPLLAA